MKENPELQSLDDQKELQKLREEAFRLNREEARRRESTLALAKYIALLSAVVGAIAAVLSVYDIGAVSQVFARFGSLSDVIKIIIGVVFGVLIAMIVQRSLRVTEIRIVFKPQRKVSKRRRKKPRVKE